MSSHRRRRCATTRGSSPPRSCSAVARSSSEVSSASTATGPGPSSTTTASCSRCTSRTATARSSPPCSSLGSLASTMRTLRHLDECPRPAQGTAVTIGAYDGVHLGHRAVIAHVRDLAQARGLETAVVTFDRHPASVVRPESAPTTLTDLEQKLELLADCGADRTLVIPFDQARAEESAEDFVETVLARALATKLVVVGSDFHFGHGRKG